MTLSEENALLRSARDWWARMAIYGWTAFGSIVAAWAIF